MQSSYTHIGTIQYESAKFFSPNFSFHDGYEQFAKSFAHQIFPLYGSLWSTCSVCVCAYVCVCVCEPPSSSTSSTSSFSPSSFLPLPYLHYSLPCSQDGRVFMHPSSVNSEKVFPSNWFVYYEKVVAHRLTHLRALAIKHALA